MNAITKSVSFAAVTLVSVTAMSSIAGATPVNNQPAPKVYVCKYVGKPGTDERLKGGKNPIHVSSNAVKGYEQGNKKFNDAQEQSVVVEDDASCTPATTPETPTTPTTPTTPGKGAVLSETTTATTPVTATPASATLVDTGTQTLLSTMLASMLVAAAAFFAFGRKAPEVCDLD